MSKLVAVAKAARLLGFKRATLQHLISTGELPSFEGRIDLEELRRRYPALAYSGDSELERVTHIRTTAFSRRVISETVPDHQALESRLEKTNVSLAVEKARANRNEAILREFLDHVGHLREGADESQKTILTHLSDWLIQRLRS